MACSWIQPLTFNCATIHECFEIVQKGKVISLRFLRTKCLLLLGFDDCTSQILQWIWTRSLLVCFSGNCSTDNIQWIPRAIHWLSSSLHRIFLSSLFFMLALCIKLPTMALKTSRNVPIPVDEGDSIAGYRLSGYSLVVSVPSRLEVHPPIIFARSTWVNSYYGSFSSYPYLYIKL